jgi:hypothetical protein
MAVAAADARTADQLLSVISDDARVGAPEHWPGLNLLGFALMGVRHQFRHDHSGWSEGSSADDPVDVGARSSGAGAGTPVPPWSKRNGG